MMTMMRNMKKRMTKTSSTASTRPGIITEGTVSLIQTMNLEGYLKTYRAFITISKIQTCCFIIIGMKCLMPKLTGIWKKIDMADEIFVINVGGYIDYSNKNGRVVRYLE